MFTVVIFKKNWADEFDCESMSLAEGSPDEVKARVEKNLVSSNYHCFGTNQEFSDEYGDSGLLISDFTFKAISDEEAEVIKKVFFDSEYKRSFGLGASDVALEEY